MLRFVWIALLVLLPGAIAKADDTGVAQMLHDARRVGNKLCLTDHAHDGYSSGAASRKAAEAEAVKAWAEFTAWEYGTDWAQWGKAVGKRLTCSEAGTSWGCHAEGRPCRDAVSGGAARARR
jgi:hypothetical protein